MILLINLILLITPSSSHGSEYQRNLNGISTIPEMSGAEPGLPVRLERLLSVLNIIMSVLGYQR